MPCEGSKLIGTFQKPSGPLGKRIEIRWHRLLLPNKWSMLMPQMPSTDAAGNAGVRDHLDFNAALTSNLRTFAASLRAQLAIRGRKVGSQFASDNKSKSLAGTLSNGGSR